MTVQSDMRSSEALSLDESLDVVRSAADRRVRLPRLPLLSTPFALAAGTIAAEVSSRRLNGPSWEVFAAVALWTAALSPTLARGRRSLVPRLHSLIGPTGLTLSTVAVGASLGLLTSEALVATVATVLITAGLFATLGLLEVLRSRPRVLLVGTGDRVSATAMAWSTSGRVDVVGTCDLPEGGVSESFADHVLDTAGSLAADLVLLAPPPRMRPSDLRRMAKPLERSRVGLGLVSDVAPVAPHRLRAGLLGGHLVLEIASSRRPWSVRTTKAVLDRIGALVLLVLTLPVFVAVAVVIRLDSPGPVFFKQIRVGRNGRLFTMYKLRTMRMDAETLRIPLQRVHPSQQLLFKLRNDPRITTCGRWLRRSSLDELPQLLNVLLGHMSLVGPRPALPEEVARYDEDALHRLIVRPGLSGLWQVSGRSDLDWKQSLALDLHYVDNGRLVDDLVILARTVRAVLHGRGAY